VLKTGAGTGLAAALAGCFGGDSDSDNGGGPSDDGELDAVPSGVSTVVSIDTDRLLDDELARQGINRALELLARQNSAAPPAANYQEVLSMIESEVGLDLQGLQSALFFADMAGETAGLIFEADWSEDEIVGAIETDGADLSKQSQDGYTIYESDGGDGSLVVLDGGRYLVGPESGINGVLDVLAGEADPVGGAVADAYANTSGMARFAADVPGDAFKNTEELSAMQEVTTVSGSLTASGDTRTFTVELSASDESAAEELVEQADALLTLAEGQIDQYPEIQEYIEDPEAQLDAIDISQSGSTVTVTYGGSVELVAEGGMLILAAVVASFVLGLGESVEQTAPQANFAMDYAAGAGETSWPDVQNASAGDGTLTITHAGGDSIRAGNLSVTGGIGGRVSWANASTHDSESAITAGETVEYRVDSDDTVRVVWSDETAGSSAELWRWVGPDA
jgi:FlaG/FlaF family flagellin (archaellin)